MSLVSVESLGFSYGGKPLFTEMRFVVDEADRLALIGPNGSGKSTLLGLLAGMRTPDSGRISIRRGTRAAYVQQHDRFPADATVESVLEANRPSSTSGEHEGRIRRIIGELEFPDKTVAVSTLSGGWRKRLSIAAGLISCPDLLLLDEPTNHLDLDGIIWLEKQLDEFQGAVVFVTHDRILIERVAKKVLEISQRYPAGFLLTNGGYGDFLEQREERLAELTSQQESLANKVRREIAWLRRGPKAQRSKSVARIRKAHDLIAELKQMQVTSTEISMQFQEGGKRAKELVKLENIDLEVGNKRLLTAFSATVAAGTRVGIVGGNGSGKSSLLRLIHGDLLPLHGHLKRGYGVTMAYFTQYRDGLDPERTLQQTLAPEGNHVVFQGRELHVSAWAAKFGLRGDLLRTPVGNLSGGEQARVAIARLVLTTCDVLMLDEPTNDLDINTLEALEEALLEFPGAVILVSHDRYLLDRVSTQLIGLRGNGEWVVCASFQQWEEIRQAWAQEEQERASPASAPPVIEATPKSTTLFSYKHHRELSGMEEKIERAEAKLKALEQAAQGAVARDAAAELYQQVAEQQKEIDRLYARWEELDQLRRESER